jgi:hypothetical protein
MLAWAKVGAAESSEFDLKSDIGEVVLWSEIEKLSDPELLSLDEKLVQKVIFDETPDLQLFNEILAKWKTRRRQAEERLSTFGGKVADPAWFVKTVYSLSERLLKLKESKLKLNRLEDASFGESIKARDLSESVRLGTIVARIEMAAISHAIRKISNTQLTQALQGNDSMGSSPASILARIAFQELESFTRLGSSLQLSKIETFVFHFDRIVQFVDGYRLQTMPQSKNPKSLNPSLLPSRKLQPKLDFLEEGLELASSHAFFLTRTYILSNRLSLHQSGEMPSSWQYPLMIELHRSAKGLERSFFPEHNPPSAGSLPPVEQWLQLVEEFTVFLEATVDYPERFYDPSLEADESNLRLAMILETAEWEIVFFERALEPSAGNKTSNALMKRYRDRAKLTMEHLARVWLQTSSRILPFDVFGQWETRKNLLDARFSRLLSRLSSGSTVRQR